MTTPRPPEPLTEEEEAALRQLARTKSDKWRPHVHSLRRLLATLDAARAAREPLDEDRLAHAYNNIVGLKYQWAGTPLTIAMWAEVAAEYAALASGSASAEPTDDPGAAAIAGHSCPQCRRVAARKRR